jgi:hypothetical protein
MRPIGLEDKESSPKSSDVNFWPASNPASKRIPVPEFPQSMGDCGGESCIDLP